MTDACGGGAESASHGVYANLDPETHDVDMGFETGAPFGTLVVGDTLDVDVRIQASSSQDVTAFQVILTFDDSIVRVESDSDCVQGSDWASSFACTTNDPTNEVLMVGSCGLSPSSACGTRGLLTVGTVTFKAIAEGVVDITGDIIKIKDDSLTTENMAIFAGTDVLAVALSLIHI